MSRKCGIARLDPGCFPAPTNNWATVPTVDPGFDATFDNGSTGSGNTSGGEQVAFLGLGGLFGASSTATGGAMAGGGYQIIKPSITGTPGYYSPSQDRYIQGTPGYVTPDSGSYGTPPSLTQTIIDGVTTVSPILGTAVNIMMNSGGSDGASIPSIGPYVG